MLRQGPALERPLHPADRPGRSPGTESMSASAISITTLAELASAGVLRAVQLVGQVGGYAVMVRVGQTEK